MRQKERGKEKKIVGKIDLESGKLDSCLKFKTRNILSFLLFIINSIFAILIGLYNKNNLIMPNSIYIYEKWTIKSFYWNIPFIISRHMFIFTCSFLKLNFHIINIWKWLETTWHLYLFVCMSVYIPASVRLNFLLCVQSKS